MALQNIASVANDGDLQQRVAAYVATKGQDDPVGWAIDHRWAVAASTGIADAWAYAKDNFMDRPGWRPGAVTDDMITAAVDAILAAETPA
jgi:hypothetical protein